jgi:hypothetical protein
LENLSLQDIAHPTTNSTLPDSPPAATGWSLPRPKA